MPKAVHELAEDLKGHPGVRNPWALAHAIVNRRHKAAAARKAHRERLQQEGKSDA